MVVLEYRLIRAQSWFDANFEPGNESVVEPTKTDEGGEGGLSWNDNEIQWGNTDVNQRPLGKDGALRGMYRSHKGDRQEGWQERRRTGRSHQVA